MKKSLLLSQSIQLNDVIGSPKSVKANLKVGTFEKSEVFAKTTFDESQDQNRDLFKSLTYKKLSSTGSIESENVENS